MPYKVPSSEAGLRGYGFELVLPVELNDIRIESVLIRLMERALRGGRISRHKTQADNYEGYLEDLSSLETLVGFNDEVGKAVLDGWLRNSIVRMGAVGLKRTGSQMDYLRPLTIATFRSGLPRQNWYYRKADGAIYRSLSHAVAKRNGLIDDGATRNAVRELFKENLGYGIDPGAAPHISPHYDDKNSPMVDINELLQLRFLEVFPRGADAANELSAREEAVPEAIYPIGEDLLSLFEKFGVQGEGWAGPELVAAATALISYRMFQLPLLLAQACEKVLSVESDQSNGELELMASMYEIYCDLTNDPNGHSRELAQFCVARDLEATRQFFIDRVTLRTLFDVAPLVDKYMDLTTMTPPIALVALGKMKQDEEVELACRTKFRIIKDQVLAEPENTDYEDYFTDLESRQASWLSKLVDVQVTSQNEQAMMQQVKWFWSTGGLLSGGKAGMQSYSLLHGNGHRPNWAYAPSDELLRILITLVFTDDDFNQPLSNQLPLGEVLSRLHTRFGILISQPPAGIDSSENRKAAAENLNAFMQKLRQLGCYRGLTDDLSAQFVDRPRSKA